MTDITELAKSLKAAAENAGADCWQAKKISGDFYVIRKGSYKRECGYTTYQPIAEIDHKPTRNYVTMANPTNILALVEALEKAQQRIAELEAREVRSMMFIDGDISPADAEKLAAVIRQFNEETESPAARMARIIRENPHPTNMCDMPAAGIKWEAE